MASSFSKAFAMVLNVKIVDGDDLIAAQSKAKLCGLQRSSAFMIPLAGMERIWISEEPVFIAIQWSASGAAANASNRASIFGTSCLGGTVLS